MMFQRVNSLVHAHLSVIPRMALMLLIALCGLFAARPALAAPLSVKFTKTSQTTANETGTVTITAQLSAVAAVDVSVPYTMSGTATEGVDYTITATPLVITAGQTTGDITLTLTQDALDEVNETAIITIGTPTNATKGSPSVQTVTISDDDAPPTAVFTAATQSVDEDAGTITVTVNLSVVSGRDVSIPFTVSGSAGAGDVTLDTPSPLAIPAGDTSGSITFTLTDDAVDEPDETVIVTMGTTTPTAVKGTPAEQTITITDNDPLAAIAVDDATVAEGDAGQTAMTFTVSLDTASAKTITVDYATADDTATAGADYTAASGTLTFAPGETSKTVTVQVAGDTTDEIDETLTLTLSNAGNGSLGDGIGTGTITDDDAAPTLSISDASVTEGDTGTANLTYTVTLSAASGKEVTVDYSTPGIVQNGGGGGSDYTATSGTLTFAAGETSKTVTV